MTVLINSQWQASGDGRRYPLGAHRIQHMLSETLNPIVPDVSFEAASFAVSDGVRNNNEIMLSLDAVASALTSIDGPLFNLGCDCGGELVPISRLNQIHGGALRVIWFDAHPDLNSVKSSPSHNFHGMVLRALMGDCPEQFSHHVPQALRPENIVLAGIRDFDPAEKRFIEDKNLTLISAEKLITGVNPTLMQALEGGPVYIHVDYDVLDPHHHPNALYQVPGGVRVRQLLDWIEAIRSRFNVVGYSLTEFAPRSACADDSDVRDILAVGYGLPLRRSLETSTV